MPKKTCVGTVVSNKMTGTIVVAVDRMKMHPLYHKQYRTTHKYHADTNGKTFELGETVTIEETRPMSKTKSWKVVG